MKTNLIYGFFTIVLLFIGLNINAQSGWTEHYSCSLTSQEEFNTWQVIDYNGGYGWGSPADGYTFKFTATGRSTSITAYKPFNSGPCVYFNSDYTYSAMADLLVSPDIILEAGKKYRITFEAFTTGSEGSSKTHTIEVRLGTGQFDKKLAQYYSMKSDAGWSINPTTNQIAASASGGNIDGFTVSETKAYKIAIYNCSGPDKGDICFRNFKLYVESTGHIVTINNPANGTLTVKDGSTVINSGDKVQNNTLLLVVATPNSGYALEQITVNGNPIESSISVTENITIDATFVKALNTVQWTNPTGGTISVKNQGVNVDNGSAVESGTTLTVNVDVEPGYKLIGVNINSNPLIGNEFTITQNTTIEAIVDINSHLVRLPFELEGATINVVNGNYEPIDDAYIVIDQQEFEFTVILDQAYSQSNYSVYANDVKLDPTAGELSNATYKIPSVTEDVEIRIDGMTKNKYVVKMPNVEGATFTVTDVTYNAELQGYEVTHGESLQFAVQIDQAYSQSNYTVYANDVELDATDENATYILQSVAADTQISIEGVEINKYIVKMPTNEGVTFVITGASYNQQAEGYEVNYDEGIEIEVKLSDAYSLSTYTLTSTPADMLNNLGGGKYSISNIKTNISIAIQGLELNKYQVTIPPVEGVTVNVIDTKAAYTVTHGDSFKFSVTLQEGYTNSKYKVSSEPVGLVTPYGSNQFQITNIEGDVNIVISDVEPNKYVVKLPTNVTGATITAIEGQPGEAQGDYMVAYGKTFKFRILLDPAYNNSNYIVKANGQTLNIASGTLPNATYEVLNVKANVDITVESIVINKYTITVTQSDNGTITPGTKTIEHGSDLTFTITPDVNYNIKEVWIDEQKIDPVVSSYTFNNIAASHSIRAVFEYLESVESVNQLSLRIYPNPIRETMTIEGEYQTIEIYSITGELLITANGESKIDCSNLPKGTYLVKAYNDKNTKTYKVVK